MLSLLAFDAGRERGDATSFLSNGEYYKILDTTDLEKRMSTYETTRFSCPAEQPDNYTIDDQGFLFMHCNEFAVDQSRAYANVLELDESNFRVPDERHAEFVLRWTLPTQSERCMRCSYLPTCYGGCPLGRIAGGDGVHCTRKREDADAFVLERYRELVGQASC